MKPPREIRHMYYVERPVTALFPFDIIICKPYKMRFRHPHNDHAPYMHKIKTDLLAFILSEIVTTTQSSFAMEINFDKFICCEDSDPHWFDCPVQISGSGHLHLLQTEVTPLSS